MSDRPAPSPIAGMLPPDGPPWIGPIVPRSRYERQWLGVHLAMVAAATVFFGWRGLFMIALTATMALGVFALVSAPRRIVRGRWDPVRVGYVLNMGLLMGCTLSMMDELWLAVRAGVGVGLFCYVMGPANRLRVHPVALTQVLLVLPLAWLGQPDVWKEQVLAPSHVVIGDVWNVRPPREGAAYWVNMSTLRPVEETPEGARAPDVPHAVFRPDPSRALLDHQRPILGNQMHLVDLLQKGDLPRLVDVLLGARPGPVGATSTLLIILLGLWLMYRRLGRWPVALIGVGAAIVALLLMPVYRLGVWQTSVQCMADVGWKVAVAYFGYQLFATPLPLILLILAPRCMPRSRTGRAIYALIIGAGVVAARWFIPAPASAYLALVVAGLLVPLLDRLQHSPFVKQSTG